MSSELKLPPRPEHPLSVLTGMGYLFPWGDAGPLVFYMADHARVWIYALDLRQGTKYELELDPGAEAYDAVVALATHMNGKGYPEFPPIAEEFKRRCGRGNQAPRI